jgi:hypothetical protein
MKKLLILFSLFFAVSTQAMDQGGLLAIGFHITTGGSSDGFLTYVCRSPIASGQVVYITNKFYYSGAFGDVDSKGSGTNRSAFHRTIKLTFNESVSVGETFVVSWTSSTVSSTKGVAIFQGSGTFDFGSSQYDKIIWLYEDNSGALNVINALMYQEGSGSNVWTSDNDLPSGIKFVGITGHSAPYNSLNLGISGNSQKCGSWWDNASAVNYNSAINTTFYNLSKWISSTSNGMNPCDQSSVETNLVTYLESNISMNALVLSYGKKRAMASSVMDPGYWYKNGTKQASGYDPWVSESQSDMLMSTVFLYDDYTLGNFSTSSSSNTKETFYIGSLVLVDSTGHTNTKLTVSAGDALAVQYKITMSDKVTGDSDYPFISMVSNVDANNAIHYAQLEPSTAVLNGKYEYKLYIAQPGWHRIYSPISQTWSGVGISNNNFQLKYGSTAPTRNIYYYDASGPQVGGSTSFWQYVSNTDDASDRPVNIYFAPGGLETPCILTFKGALKYPDLDNETKLSSSTTSNALNSSSPGYGAPWYGVNYNGWNLYGNHGLTFLKVADIKSNYYDLTQIWDPYKNGTIGSAGVSNYYSHNGQTGDALAEYIPPFTAFFMNTTSPGSNGYVVGRKAMSPGQHTGISNKTGNTIGLTARNNVGIEQNVYASPIPESLSSKSGLNYNAVSSGLGEGMLFIHEDSSFFRIRQTEDPIEYREFPVAFTSSDHGGEFTIANHVDFPEGLNSYLVDLKMQKIHDLGGTDYSFEHDTAFGCDRFKWILSNSTVKLEELTTLDPLKVFVDAHGSMQILNCEGTGNIEIYNEVGALIETLENHQNTTEITVPGVSNWQSGLYFIKSASGAWQKVFIP